MSSRADRCIHLARALDSQLQSVPDLLTEAPTPISPPSTFRPLSYPARPILQQGGAGATSTLPIRPDDQHEYSVLFPGELHGSRTTKGTGRIRNHYPPSLAPWDHRRIRYCDSQPRGSCLLCRFGCRRTAVSGPGKGALRVPDPLGHDGRWQGGMLHGAGLGRVCRMWDWKSIAGRDGEG